jgi:feruloyl esterase
LRKLPVGVSQPAAGSRIGFEVWLPKADWNGRLKMFGNAGYSSAVPYAEMAAHVKQGYAVVGTDTGHSGDTPAFAQDNPEAIVDWVCCAEPAQAPRLQRPAINYLR